jgi:predicted membrane-bound spermidine synthase
LIYSGLALLLMVSAPTDLPLYEHLFAYWRQYEEFQFGADWSWRWVLSLYLALPVFLYGPPTVLMGLSFAILQRAVHDDLRTTGLKVGILQTGNIVGNVAGSLLAGLLFLNLVGTTGTLKLLIGIGVAFALVGVHYYGLRTSFGVLAPALLVLLLILPDGDALWPRLHGQRGEDALSDEDASGLAAITRDGSMLRVSINGKGQSTLPFGGLHSRLGAIPALIHPAPVEVAIIGLGSGDTAWAAGCRQETRRIHVFEILTPIERLLMRVKQVSLPKLQGFLADPRVVIIIADGRNALAMSDRQYDLIEADALRPHSAYSGNLYSLEFFRMCSQRLKPGGVMCTWSPTPRVYRTFSEAFPYVLELERGEILIGANEPLEIRIEEWVDLLGSERLRSYLGPRISAGVRRSLKTARPAASADHRHLRLNRDLIPRDEFRAPQLRRH